MILVLKIVTIAGVGESVFKLFYFLLRTFQILTCEGIIKHWMPHKVLQSSTRHFLPVSCRMGSSDES